MQTLGSAAAQNLVVADADDNVIASFQPEKGYQNVVVSAPGLALGETYTLYLDAQVEGADANGYTDQGTCAGGTAAAEIKMSSVSVGGGSGGETGGMGGGPGGGGRR